MNVPRHVAIIMDGNGRWAVNRRKTRVWGHIRGASLVSKIVERANELKVSALTLFTFSTENWARPSGEIRVLFSLLKKFLLHEEKKIIQNRIRFRILGDKSSLEEETLALVNGLEERTKDFDGLILTFAFDYGGRRDIIKSCNEFIKKNPGKQLEEETLGSYFQSHEAGDVDLLIRTGGDFRISNFLLWHLAYAELYFTQIAWPDFTPEDFTKILTEVATRNRRFGGIEEDNTYRLALEDAREKRNLWPMR